jgi:predicted kinase
MQKKVLAKPVLIILYGFPGSGKSFFGRQISSDIGAAHVNGDQLRFEFFENPLFNKEEDDVVEHLSLYMVEQFLQTGTSVVYDTNASRTAQRRLLRDIAARTKTEVITVWLQLDMETAFDRVVKRDRRKADDKFSRSMDRTTFESVISRMQNPSLLEDSVVVSGKHTFVSQKNATYKKLLEKGLLNLDSNSKVVKPELVNLVPNSLGGRVDETRRNIVIR